MVFRRFREGLAQLLQLLILTPTEVKIRQWRTLGVLLHRLSLADSLTILEHVYGSYQVYWRGLKWEVAVGGTLSAALERCTKLPLPPEIVAAVRAGEADGSLAKRLETLGGDRVWPLPDEIEGSPDNEMVKVVNMMILDAGRLRAQSILLAPGRIREAPVQFLVGDAWTPYALRPIDESIEDPLPSDATEIAVRMLLARVGIAYWEKGEASGTARLQDSTPLMGTMQVTRLADASVRVELAFG